MRNKTFILVVLLLLPIGANAQKRRKEKPTPVEMNYKSVTCEKANVPYQILPLGTDITDTLVAVKDSVIYDREVCVVLNTRTQTYGYFLKDVLKDNLYYKRAEQNKIPLRLEGKEILSAVDYSEGSLLTFNNPFELEKKPYFIPHENRRNYKYTPSGNMVTEKYEYTSAGMRLTTTVTYSKDGSYYRQTTRDPYGNVILDFKMK